jgi:AcrR family transcriptional regulator
MRNDRHLAIKLRKKGMSYNKISKELGIPKSTMHYWFRNEPWSQEIKKELNRRNIYVAKKRLRLIIKARKEKWKKWREAHRQAAKKEFPHLKKNPLFLAGLMLYWGEGDSKIANCQVRLSNTDPEMIRIFSLFLQKVCKIPRCKIKIELTLYPDLNEEVCKKFWHKASGIPIAQFRKAKFIKGKHPTKRLSYGICNINFNSRELKEKIFTWLKLYQKELKRV